MHWISASILLFAALRGPDAGASAQQAVDTTDVRPYPTSSAGTLSGELRMWHKLTLGFEGPATNETNNVTNPFTDYRLDVDFVHMASDTKYTVPGYYACDANAANNGADSGSTWLVHFAADLVGTWTWSVSFTTGPNVALSTYRSGTTAGHFDGASGSFVMDETNKGGRDHRGKGRLQYVNEHYLRYAGTKEWFLKAGADSPENFLEYADFDNSSSNQTGNLKTWEPHVRDFNAGDATWAGGKGKGMIGAVNYLADKGMRSFSFIPMTIEGDAKSVFPYISDRKEDWLRMDCSKLAQWDVIFEHADRRGVMMHFKTQEQENDQLLDGGDLGPERRLYYRELIARFGHHLAITWDLGEENTNTNEQLKSVCIVRTIIFWFIVHHSLTCPRLLCSFRTTLSKWIHTITQSCVMFTKKKRAKQSSHRFWVTRHLMEHLSRQVTHSRFTTVHWTGFDVRLLLVTSGL